MTVEFDIKLTCRDIYRFNMYQTYSGMQGWISVIVAVLLFARMVTTFGTVSATNTLLYALFGIVMLLYFPLFLYLRSRQSLAASEALRETLHYAVDENGFTASRGEESGLLKWEQIYKMVATKNNVLVYSNRINAYVIPREQLGGKYEALAALAKANLEKHRVKMR